MSETDRSDSPARVPAVLAVLVEVELDPAALDEDSAARAVADVGARVAGAALARGVRAGAYASRLLRCSLPALAGALDKVSP